MNPNVTELLLSSAAVVAIVGSAVFRDPAPQDHIGPYVVWFVVSAVPELNLAEVPGVDEQRIQIDCYSDSQPQAGLLAAAVRGIIETETHVLLGPDELGVEPDTELYRWTMDAAFWHPRG